MIKIICRVISVLFGASLFYYMPTLLIRMFGLENKWPNLITNVLGYEIIWPSLLFGVLGGIIGLFMDETSGQVLTLWNLIFYTKIRPHSINTLNR